jgi:alpha-galactosidase
MIALRAAGVMVVLDTSGPKLPRVVHWGADLGPLDEPGLAALRDAALPNVHRSAPDERVLVTILPAQGDGWPGRPGVRGHRDGRSPHPRFTVSHVDASGSGVLVRGSDAGLEVLSEFELTPSGVLRVRHTVTNTGDDVWTCDGLTAVMPVGAQATQLLDFTGRWPREKQPQRAAFQHGVRVRENRRGHTGHDATGLMVVGTEGFGFRHGEVWGVHIGWSGDHVHIAERQPEGVRLLGGGELLGPGEIRLGPGESYASPWAYFAYASNGLDGLSQSLHRYLRARPDHPRTPRPVVLNTWEAVYFDHRLDRLTELADVAARAGVERFVLDDGWFLGRRDDTAGLGDWYVDAAVWPDGLGPLVQHVRSLGMQFGLWFEPEMVNPRSSLMREHPDWVLAERLPMLQRNQLVLDVARADVFDYLLDRIVSLVQEYGIDYIKWDHNRDLLEAVHDGRYGVHAQTLAVYRLMAAVRAACPSLEIESCSGGGARIDYGVLEHTDRVWTSDTNDALERQAIQRWTGLLVAPELLGAHVGPPVAHTTGRAAGLEFRQATALFGHAGLEWDLTGLSPSSLSSVASWISLYKRLRPLLHSGDTVHADYADPSAVLHGVVSPDRQHAVYCFAQLDAPLDVAPPPLVLPGLDPDARYAVSCVLRPPSVVETPAWLAPVPTADAATPGAFTSGASTSGAGWVGPGAVLGRAGLTAPLLNPAEAIVLEVRTVE